MSKEKVVLIFYLNVIYVFLHVYFPVIKRCLYSQSENNCFFFKKACILNFNYEMNRLIVL